MNSLVIHVQRSPSEPIRMLVASLWITILFAACGSSSPTSPTPPVGNAPPPPAAVATLSFTPQSASPAGAALAIMVASRGQEAGKIALAVTAHNLANVHKVRGTVRWDPNVLEYDSWGEGDWLKQGGALVDWTHFTSSPGEFGLFLDRPTTLPPATGSGEVILLRLKPRAGVRSGSSPIQWDEPSVLTSTFARVTLTNTYGGTVTIQ